MKVACESCGARYTIADEKVEGKVFKIRCKRCSQIIVARSPAAAPPVDDGMIWHAVVDGEHVGPMTVGEVEARLASGAIDRASYMWREGMSEWEPLGQVSELAMLVQPAPRGGVQGLRTPRNESSVLFSLGTLAALGDGARAAASAPAPAGAAAGQEGSGLIDIRSLASTFVGSSRPTPGMAAAPHVGSMEDLPTFVTPVFVEPAVIIPGGAAGGNRMIGVLLAAVAVLTVLAGILLYVALGRDQAATPAPGSPAPAPAPVTATPAPASHAPVALAPVEPPPALPPLQAEPPAAPAPVARPRAHPTAPPRVRSTPETPAVRPTPTTPVAGKTCVLDQVGCLLAERRPACCSIYDGAAKPDPEPTPKPVPVESTELPESLSRADVSAALARVESRVRACGATSPAKGKVMVEIKVAPAGNVTAATVKEAPDPALGTCVASAVGKASFARTRSTGKFQLPYRF